MSLSKLRVLVMDTEAWHAVILGVTKSWTRMSDLTELNVAHLIQSMIELNTLELKLLG